MSVAARSHPATRSLTKLGEGLCAKTVDAATAAMTPQNNHRAQVTLFMFASRQMHPPEMYLHCQHTLPYASPPPFGYASRYQNARSQRIESQGLNAMPRKVWLTADTSLRQTTGMTTTSSMSKSFIRMNSVARLTGSNSLSACFQR